MPVDTKEIINYVSRLAKEERLRVTLNESVKGGLYAGGMAILGSLMGGPVGIAVGGTVGGILGAAEVKNFKPVHEVIALMDQEKKEALAENVRSIMRSVDVTDVAMLAKDLATKSKVVRAIVDFFKDQLGLAIADH